MNADRYGKVRIIFLAVAVLFSAALLAQEKLEVKLRLDINAATAEELQKLPEIGEKVAGAIVRFREKSGRFRRVEELLAVPGITKRRLEKIRPYVYVKEEKPPRAATGRSPETALHLHERKGDGAGEELNGNHGLREHPQCGPGGGEPRKFTGEMTGGTHRV